METTTRISTVVPDLLQFLCNEGPSLSVPSPITLTFHISTFLLPPHVMNDVWEGPITLCRVTSLVTGSPVVPITLQYNGRSFGDVRLGRVHGF